MRTRTINLRTVKKRCAVRFWFLVRFRGGIQGSAVPKLPKDGYGNRTRVIRLKALCPRPLDEPTGKRVLIASRAAKPVSCTRWCCISHIYYCYREMNLFPTPTSAPSRWAAIARFVSVFGLSPLPVIILYHNCGKKSTPFRIFLFCTKILSLIYYFCVFCSPAYALLYCFNSLKCLHGVVSIC